MGRKGWVVLVLCVAAIVAAAMGYARCRRGHRAAAGVEPQTGISALVPPSGTGGAHARSERSVGRERSARVVTYAVKKGDTLRAISLRILGDAAQWRAIAKENGIRGSRVKAGTQLRITVPSPN